MKRHYVIYLLFAVSVALNVASAYKLRQLGYFEQLKVQQKADRLLKVGATVQPFRAADLKGLDHLISFDAGGEKPTVLYVFTPPCRWCERNANNINALVAQKSDEFQFIGISLAKDGLPDYVANNGLTIPVYTDLSEETKKAYKMGGTPQTIVVSPAGQVLQSWAGAYTGEQQKQVERFFGVALPGLKTEGK
jgi:peroxiredoxin